MELLTDTPRQPVLRGLKRKCGQITSDPGMGLADPDCYYAQELGLAPPTLETVEPEAFGALTEEAFWKASTFASLPLAKTETGIGAEPSPHRKQWQDVPCPACDTHNWYWRHCCRSCRKDSTGYEHRLHKCTCHGCAAERGWQFEAADGW